MHKYLLSLFILLFFSACTSSPEVRQNKPAGLTALLYSLDADISLEEAEKLSKEIIFEIDKLRQKFDPVSEPHVNNFLINVGVKKQGLCYEWSDALYMHFKHKQYPHFSFHLLVADKGEYFFEHNVMVVTAKEGKVMDGVIIDPWRKPGSLYFSKVQDDQGYDWKWRKEREENGVDVVQ